MWIILSGLLICASLGVSGILTVILVIFTLSATLVLTLYLISRHQNIRVDVPEISLSSSFQFNADHPGNVDKYDEDDDEGDNFSDFETRLSGHPAIDQQLSEIIYFVFRDYIHSWHVRLTHSRAFTAAVTKMVEIVIRNLSIKIRKVDWIPFLTTKLVDDVASHVRLFKRARQTKRDRTTSDEVAKIPPDLESLFFDGEVAMEGNLCRDSVCMIHQEEINFLQDVAELVLYLLLPQEDFGTRSLRMLTREVLVNVVLKPTFDLLSDPDFINQNIVWLYKNYTIKPDVFSLTIRYSENIEELQATRESVNKEINFLRSNDSKGEMDSSLKQQLSSLLYLRKVIDSRIHRLQSGSLDSDSTGFPASIDWNQKIGPGLTLFDLPLEVIVKNNIALSYFIDFMSSIGNQSYLFFYLNVEGWKVSAEQRLQNIALYDLNPDGEFHDKDAIVENIRESAHSIYEEYLSEKANPRLRIDDSVIKRLLFKIRTRVPDPDWFDEAQDAVYEKLRVDDRFLDSFKKSMGYVKLLAELDLLRVKNEGEDDDEDEEEDQDDDGDDDDYFFDNESLSSYEFANDIGYHQSDGSLGGRSRASSPSRKTHSRKSSGVLLKSHSRNPSLGSLSSIGEGSGRLGVSHVSVKTSDENLYNVLSADILEYRVVKTSGKPYALYTILVKSRSNKHGANEDVRYIFRRYSDFYALHEKVSTAFPTLDKIKFPSKRTFGNMERNHIEKRKLVLNEYLKELLRNENLLEFPGLLDLLKKFLDEAGYEKERIEASSNVTKVLVNPLKNSVKTVSRTVTSVPTHLINTVDTVMDGLTKALIQNKSANFDEKVSASIDSDTTDNIPLRIMLLFMDEVFDLQDRNQWLRRQIVTVLRQIIKSMFGDIVNRRIIDYFIQMTSPERISGYLTSFKDSFWPKGVPAVSRPVRDENTKMRTRIAAKSAMFSSLSDDLRRVIGSETSRAGLLIIFDMIQHPTLNKRLVLVLFEGILKTLFDEHDFQDLFLKLHSRSSRVKNELRISQRKQVDLRR